MLDLWCFNLDQSPQKIERYRTLLSPEEVARADRYKTELLKHRFITARGMLRETLSQYATIPPQQLLFQTGQYGKPYLVNHSIHFNLSHSGKYGGLIISDEAVGIDLEVIRDIEVNAISERFFHPDEVLYLKNLSSELQLKQFYRIWTGKEASLKAQGYGITHHLNAFSVLQSPVQLPRHHEYWHLHYEELHPNCALTIAYASLNKSIRIKSLAL